MPNEVAHNHSNNLSVSTGKSKGRCEEIFIERQFILIFELHLSYQLTFSDSEFNNKRRRAGKEVFLSRMDELMPWDQFEAVIKPFYTKPEKENDRILCPPCFAFTACNIGTT